MSLWFFDCCSVYGVGAADEGDDADMPECAEYGEVGEEVGEECLGDVLPDDRWAVVEDRFFVDEELGPEGEEEAEECEFDFYIGRFFVFEDKEKYVEADAEDEDEGEGVEE